DDGDHDQADLIRQQILSADPHASTEPLTRQQVAASDDLALDTGHISPRGAQPPRSPSEDLSAFNLDAQDYGNVDLDVQPLAGLEHTMLDAGAAPPFARAGEEEVEGPEDLPLINFDAAPESGRPAPSPSPAADPARFGEVSLDDRPVDFGPGME